MSFAYPGITHCVKCHIPLDMNEHYYCKSCQEEEGRERERFEQEKKEKELKNQIKGEMVDIMKEFSSVMAESKSISTEESNQFATQTNIEPNKPKNTTYNDWYQDIGYKIISLYNAGYKNIRINFIEEESDDNE